VFRRLCLSLSRRPTVRPSPFRSNLLGRLVDSCLMPRPKDATLRRRERLSAKQVAQDLRTGEIRVLDLSKPASLPHGALVHISHSVISAGTECAKSELGQSSMMGKARKRPDDVSKVLAKATRRVSQAARTARRRGEVRLGGHGTAANIAMDAETTFASSGRNRPFVQSSRLRICGRARPSQLSEVLKPRSPFARIAPSVVSTGR
jgi:hypothetical protein